MLGESIPQIENIPEIDQEQNKREKLTQEQVHKYLFDLIEHSTGSPDDLALHVIYDFLPQNISVGDKDENGETLWDKVWREIPLIYDIDYEFGHALENYIGQNGFMIRVDIFLDVIFDEYCINPDSYFYKDSLHSINFVYSYNSLDRFNSFFFQKLDFNNPKNFDKTAKALDLLNVLFNIGQTNNSWSNTPEHIKVLLEDVVKNSSGSYFLNLKAQELLANINSALMVDDYAYQENDDGIVGLNSYMMTPQMRKLVNESLGITVESLSESEQEYFLDYIKGKPAKDISAVKAFCAKYGNDGLRTFLSLEHNKELGDRIIDFGNRVNEGVAKAVFEKYGEIVDASNQVMEYLKNEFGKSDEYTPEIISDISGKLFKDGCALLEGYVNGGVDNMDTDLDSVRGSLDLIKTDTLAFLHAFRTLKTYNQEFSLEDVKNLELKTEISTEISESDKANMVQMYESNYQKHPKLAGFLVGKFIESLRQEGNTISILRRNGNIVAFYRLSQTAVDRVLYFGSFNVDPTYQGALLGETLMQESLDTKAKDCVIIAECNPQVAVSANYIERGFIGVRKDHIEEIDVLEINRNDLFNKQLITKQISNDDIISNGIKGDRVHVYTIPTRDIEREKFDFVGRKTSIGTEVLTRYFRDKKTGMTYFVTEEVTEDFLEKYSMPVSG